MRHVAYFVERLFAQAITDIGTHGILDENLITEDPLMKKINSKRN